MIGNLPADGPATPASTAVDSWGRWRARSSVSEALANLRDGSLLGAVLVAITVAVVGGALVADVLTVSRILDAEARYLDAGGDILVANGQGNATIDAGRCARLAEIRGVRAAAAVSLAPGFARLVGRPASQQTVVTATSGVLELFDRSQLAADQVLISQTIAERWQWAPGSHLQLDPADAAALGAPSGVLTVADVVNLGLLSEGASTGILAVRAPTGQADNCFVRIEPQYRDDLAAAIPALLGETSVGTVLVADRLPAGAFAENPAGAFDSRITRWAPGAAGAVVGLLWAVVAWTRRGRSALYASIGVPYGGGVLIRWCEGTVVVVLGGLWGAVFATGVSVAVLGASTGVALSIVLRGAGLAVAIALLLVVLVGLWRPPTLGALKDR